MTEEKTITEKEDPKDEEDNYLVENDEVINENKKGGDV